MLDLDVPGVDGTLGRPGGELPDRPEVVLSSSIGTVLFGPGWLKTTVTLHELCWRKKHEHSHNRLHIYLGAVEPCF